MKLNVIDLLKVKCGWKIILDTENHAFSTIEDAADALEQLGIPSSEIDSALISMAAVGHRRACFVEGKFKFSNNLETLN